ncbi:hypothetical protein G3M55_95735, partial [Streptomyces sp. SID8455]|nr:hypothetical protein [Streptomyces sp. SID8455]
AGSSHLPRVAALLGAALAERVGQSGSRYMPTAENEEATVLLREALAGLAEDDELRLPGHAVLGCLLNRCH